MQDLDRFVHFGLTRHIEEYQISVNLDEILRSHLVQPFLAEAFGFAFL